MNLRKSALFVALAALATAAVAEPTLPTGASVVAGSATVTPGASRLAVNQTTPRAVINWSTFSIGSGGTVQFVQPGANSAVLNRVVTSEPSAILGLLTANGQVFLVNPSGITVGSGGRIEAAGITLSTANIADADFMAGSLSFGPIPAGATVTFSGNSVLQADTIRIEPGSLGGGSGGPLLPGPIVLTPGPVIGGGTLPILPRTDGNSTVGTVNVTVTPGLAFGGGGGNAQASAGASAQQGGTLVLRPGGGVGFGPGIEVPSPKTGGSPMFTLVPAAPTPTATPAATTATAAGPRAPQPQPNAATTQAPASALRPLADTRGLTDGAVTVRLPLVDATPIVLN